MISTSYAQGQRVKGCLQDEDRNAFLQGNFEETSQCTARVCR